MILPILIGAAIGLGWLISLGTVQVKLVDAAREVARAVARDEPRGQALDLGSRIAPDGSRFSIVDEGRTVRVTVTAEVDGPGGLFGFLPPVRIDADATAAEEMS